MATSCGFESHRPHQGTARGKSLPAWLVLFCLNELMDELGERLLIAAEAFDHRFHDLVRIEALQGYGVACASARSVRKVNWVRPLPSRNGWIAFSSARKCAAFVANSLGTVFLSLFCLVSVP